MRGQVESSFQWVFVLIGGAVFFGLFFVLIRACVDSGESRAQGISLALAASMLEEGAWQGTSSSSRAVQPAAVSCAGGSSIVLSSERQSATLDRAPVFLPAGIGGVLGIASAQVGIQRGDAVMRLANVLYAHDEDTYYLVIPGEDGKRLDLGPNARELGDVGNPDEVARLVPGGARAAIIVSGGAIDLAHVDVSGIPQAVRVTGVMLGEGQAAFYTRSGGRLVQGERLPYQAEELALGAAVTGDPGLYTCGKAGLAMRMRYVTVVHQTRAAALKGISGPNCGGLLSDAETMLREINAQATDDEYLTALFGNAYRLASLQSALRAASCPVIA